MIAYNTQDYSESTLLEVFFLALLPTVLAKMSIRFNCGAS